MSEVWKPIPSYDGIYEVSSTGRVRAVDGKVTHSARHGERRWKQRILKTKPTWNKGKRYWCGERVTLWKDKKPKDYLCHRLEACAFYGLPLDTDMTVNHKDGNRKNNSISNLEFLSREDNIRHGYRTGLYASCCHQVVLKETESGKTLSFPSKQTASEYLGFNHGYLSRVIKEGRQIKSKDGRSFTLLNPITK